MGENYLHRIHDNLIVLHIYVSHCRSLLTCTQYITLVILFVIQYSKLLPYNDAVRALDKREYLVIIRDHFC